MTTTWSPATGASKWPSTKTVNPVSLFGLVDAAEDYLSSTYVAALGDLGPCPALDVRKIAGSATFAINVSF